MLCAAKIRKGEWIEAFRQMRLVQPRSGLRMSASLAASPYLQLVPDFPMNCGRLNIGVRNSITSDFAVCKVVEPKKADPQDLPLI
jgi:hypothetical protein